MKASENEGQRPTQVKSVFPRKARETVGTLVIQAEKAEDYRNSVIQKANCR